MMTRTDGVKLNAARGGMPRLGAGEGKGGDIRGVDEEIAEFFAGSPGISISLDHVPKDPPSTPSFTYWVAGAAGSSCQKHSKARFFPKVRLFPTWLLTLPLP